MSYVGIDIAKLNHFASAIDSDGTVLIEPFKFLNDNDGFYLLLSKLDPLKRTASSLVLNQLLTMETTLFPFLSQKSFMSVFSILYWHPLCGKTGSARPRLTKSILW